MPHFDTKLSELNWQRRSGRSRGLLTALFMLLTSTAWAQLSGTYYVGTGTSPDATRTYTTLPAAMTALGGGVTSGASVNFVLLDATYALGATALTVPAPTLSTGQGISIVPAAGVSPLITGSSTTGVLILDGTDFLTINGTDGTTSARTITVRNTVVGPAVLLRNDATNNALRYLILESVNTGTTSGTVLFGTSTGTTGNDTNLIANCDVRGAANIDTGATLPANAIYSLGTAAATNSGNTVQTSNVYNFTAAGIYLNDTGNGGGWTLDGNNIYQTAARTGAIRAIRLTGGDGHTVSNNNVYQITGTLGSTFYGLAMASGSGHTITNNFIGGSAAGATGSPMVVSSASATFYGFYLSLGSTTASNIQGNTIRNIATSITAGTTFGMQMISGLANVGTTAPNFIGSANPTAPAVGITATNTLYGIAIDGTSPAATVSANVVGGLSNTAGALAGIYFSGSGASSANNNTVSNLSNSTGGVLAGINLTGTGATPIINNTVSGLTQTGTTSNLYGIQSNSITGSNVTGNTITNVTYSGTSSGQTVYGIFAGGSVNITNNTVTTVQATASGNTNLRGIYVGGTGAAAVVTGNVVGNILNGTTSSTAATGISTAGIFVGPTSGVMGAVTVRGNRISNVGTTTTAASTTTTNTVTGLLCGASAVGSVIERNRIWNVYGSTASTGANADQVRGLAVQGAYSGTFANNQISLAASTVSQQTYGIQDLSSGGTNNFYYNSVYLAPAGAGAATSYAFYRSEATTPPTNLLRNNILYNDRTAATGAFAYAIGTASTSGWSAGTSNYNLFVTPSASVMANWGGANLDFAGWQAAQPAGSGGDANSYFRLNTALPAATIFIDPSANATTGGNLNINPAYYTTLSIIESGGVAVAGINSDYDGSDVRQGSPGYSGTGTAPDLGSDEYSSTPLVNMAYDPATGTAVTQITTPVPAGSTNQAIIRVALTTTGTLNPLTVTQLNFSADGTTANGALPANISNARVYFTGSSNTFATTTQFGTGTVVPAFSAAGGFVVIGNQALNEGVNYFFLTYDVAAGAPTGNVIDAILTGVKIGTSAVSSIAATIGNPAGNRPILGPMSGNYTVGYDLGTEAYPSLTAAVADLTTRGIATGQSVTLQLTNPGATKPYDAATATPAANRETFPIVIPEFSTGLGLSIVPATGVSPLITDSNANGIIILNGTDNLTINGTTGSAGVRAITIRNAGNGPAVLLRNDASGNTLRSLILESANLGTTSGTVLFSTTTGTAGNDNNLITNCDVRAANNATTGTDIPANAIYSLGTGTASGGVSAATANSGNSVQACNIYNFTGGGLYLNATGSGDSWTVGGPAAADGNTFYQSAARGITQLINIRLGGGNLHVVTNNQVYQTTGAVSNTYYGISAIGGSNGLVITNNTIGGSGPNAAGNPLSLSGAFYGINLVVGTGTAASVQGNVIRNVSNTSTTAETHGIRVDAGSGPVNMGTTTGNIIGDVNPTAPAVGLVSTRNIFGISLYSAIGSVVSGNTVAGLSYTGVTAGSVVYGVYTLVDNSAHTISGNTLTNITTTSTANANLRGIYAGGNGATPTVTDNVVSGILNGSAGANISTAGIFVGPTSGVMGPVIIRGNRISNVANTVAASPTGTNVFTTTGLLCGASAVGSVIERNRVWNVYGGSAGTGVNADQVRGLAVQGAYSGTFSNNQISLATGTVSQQTYGIQDLSSGGTNSFYYNSVYLAPANAAAAASSYAFYRSEATTPPTNLLRNNVLYNGRTAATGSSAYAIGTASTSGWSAGTSNYNLFVNTDATSVGNWGGTALSFTGWKAAQPAGSGGDASSLSTSAATVAAASLFAGIATGNLDINPANSEAWYANGNGVQIIGQTADYGSPSTGRSTTVAAGGTDIGSDEFVPTATPPALTASAAPALGGTQSFSLGGRTLATVTYAATGSVPTGITARYYSGTNPVVPAAIIRYPNSYLDVTATGGSGYTYGLVLNYDDALLGGIITEANQHLVKHNPDATYSFFATSVADAVANTLTATGLTSFGQFFTTDQTNPLPSGTSTAARLATIAAFPNPFTSVLTLEVTSATAATSVPLTLTDALGRTVYSQLVTLPAGTNRLELFQLGTLPAGVYLLHVPLAGQVINLKVVKQ